MSQNDKSITEVFEVLVRVGEAFARAAEQNRNITILSRGRVNRGRWRDAPQQLARYWRGHATVHFSSAFPNHIIIVWNGKYRNWHASRAELQFSLGRGFVQKRIVGENHPDLPYPVGVFDYTTQVWERIRASEA
jgi:hypothetical protein